MTVKKNNQLVSVVVGLQFGDEGKGKVTDYLSAKHDVVIRYNGGGNAGHTVVTQTGTFKFHLIPSGALQSEVVILTNGMVIDPIALNDEIKRLKELNPKIKIEVSEHASVVTDLHKYLDLAEEDARKALRIGTTAQGIGPTYEDKYGRTGLRMADLLDPVILKEKMLLVTRMKQSLIEGSEFIYESRLDDMVLKLHESGKILKPYLKDTCNSIQKYYSEGKNIMFEGAHGALLDIDFGIYPYVTSSNTVAGAITNDSGFSFRKVREVIGVAKAYVSKVGNGPFPTEIKGKNAEFLRQLGSEYGTTTGRPRRVGWLDIPALKYSIMINDADSISLTKIDTLGKLSSINIGISYTLDGNPLESFPSDFRALEKVKVEYEQAEPWGEITESIIEDVKRKSIAGFPFELRRYISRIEQFLGVPVKIISFGSRRDMTLDRGTPSVGTVDQII